MAARVPDLGSDFSQKLLKDLRRRRERLGFESTPAPAAASAQRSTGNAAPRSASSGSQKSLRVLLQDDPPQPQKPQQAAPRVARAEAAASRPHGQGGSPVAGAWKPRRHDAPPVAHSHAIVPFQGGGGGGRKTRPAAAAPDVDVQMALALALSRSGKLQNVHLVARHAGGSSSVFFGEPDRARARRLLAAGAHVGKVAIGLQKLNDILMAYSSYSSSSGGGAGRRSSGDVGKQLLRGAMDLEESLNMLVMLQDASDDMLLLEGKESRKNYEAPARSSSARLVEIVDEDPEAEQVGSNANGSSDASMQIVPLSTSSQASKTSNHSSALQLATVTTGAKNHGSGGGDKEEHPQVRKPSLIAKLMGLENLPSANAVAKHKGDDKFVKSPVVPRKATGRNGSMAGTLPIRIVASEKVPSEGQIKNLQGRGWNISLTNSEEPVGDTFLSNRSSHLRTDKQTRQIMGHVLGKQDSAERRVSSSISQVVVEQMAHQGLKQTEESKLQKAVSVGCRSDAGRKISFLQRLRNSAKSKAATEEKDIVQENSQKFKKKQTSNMKQTLVRESEVKPRRTRDRFNKENLGSAETRAEGKVGRTDQMRKQSQIKHKGRHMVEKRGHNYRQMQGETATQNMEQKSSLKSEATHKVQELECTAPVQLQLPDVSIKTNDTRDHILSENTPGDDITSKQPAEDMEDSSTSGRVLSDQTEKQITGEVKDGTAADSIVQTNDDRVNHMASESTGTLETFSEGEQLQQQPHRTKDENDQLRNGSDNTAKSANLTDLKNHKTSVVSCDSLTENQLLLAEMLLKDHYLLETAKAIIGIHVPINAVHVSTGKWLDKGNQVLADVGREAIRRKGKRTEAMEDVSMMPTVNLKLRSLEDLIRELDGDIQSLHIPKKRHQPCEDGTAENLRMVLLRDMESTHSDANSAWDFGWNHVRDLPIEKNEVVRDLEKSILGGIITDVARELIDVSLRRGCCLCVA